MTLFKQQPNKILKNIAEILNRKGTREHLLMLFLCLLMYINVGYMHYEVYFWVT